MRRSWIAGLVLTASLCTTVGHGARGGPPAEAPAPPVARKVPVELEAHGDVRVDDYYWLRERDDPEVVAYLEAENAYTEAMLAPHQALQDALFDEIVGRIAKDDSTPPARDGEYWYYTRYVEGGEYPIHCRRHGSLDAPEEVILDVNALAAGYEFFAVRGVEASPDHTRLAYAFDTVGRRKYRIAVIDLATGERLGEPIADVTSDLTWAEDGETILYARQHPDTLRSYQIWRHTVGTDPATATLVYEEPDEEFEAYVWKTRSRAYLIIGSYQTESSEMRFAPADRPAGEWRVFHPREPEHEYEIDHAHGWFYVRSNDGATNFRLMRTPVAETGKAHWEEVVPHRDDVLLEGFDVFRDHLVLTERREGLIHLRVRPWTGEGEYELSFDDPTYVAWVDDNREFDTAVLRYGYSSLTTPDSIYDVELTTRERTLRKREEVLGGFDPAAYRSERLWATAPDGERVPISLVYRVDRRREGGNPTLLYGYGAYGHSAEADFRSPRLSLLDRGFVYAICHVRGGEELGRRWYDAGRLHHKQNTFTDFIACGEHLVAEGIADPGQVYAEGGSAGGLLIGAVINMRPDLFRGAIADVPWVDALTTMLDETIPLTTSEYDEWGNPNEREFYDTILAYSPYDNVTAQAYPHLLVLAGLHDSQVQYWEPAKWVARLRASKTDDHWLLLRTDMAAGHGGATGRFKRHRETAIAYTFLLHLAGAAGAE